MTLDRNKNLLQVPGEAIMEGSGEAEIFGSLQQNFGSNRVTLGGGEYGQVVVDERRQSVKAQCTVEPRASARKVT